MQSAESGLPSTTQVIVLEDSEKYLQMLDPEDLEKRQRRAFRPLALVNPRIRPVGRAGARFFEGCLSVPGYQVGRNDWGMLKGGQSVHTRQLGEEATVGSCCVETRRINPARSGVAKQHLSYS